MEYIEKVKTTYITAKQLLDIASNADHPLHKQIVKAMSIKTALELRELVYDLEDHGVHLLLRGKIN